MKLTHFWMLWLETKKKDGIYGLGSQASEYYRTSGASTSISFQSAEQNTDEIMSCGRGLLNKIWLLRICQT